jgi:hypothetical protein
MTENGVREASRPSAGAGREGIRLTLATLIVGWLVPLVGVDLEPELRAMVFAVVAMGFAWLGKVLRGRNLGFLADLI